MAVRKSVITLAILSAIFFIASVAIYLIGNLALGNTYFPAFTQVFDALTAIMKDMSANIVPAIAIIACGGVFVLLGIIEIIVDCVRHRTLTGIYFLIAKIVLGFSLIFVLCVYFFNQLGGTDPFADLAASYLVLICIGLMLISGLLSFINFFVDIATGNKKTEQYNNFNYGSPATNNIYMQNENQNSDVKTNVEDNPYEEVSVASNEDVVAVADAKEVSVEEKVEPVIIEEPIEEEKDDKHDDIVRRLEALEKAEEDRKTATIKKDDVKKASKKPTKNKNATKKTTTIKKDDVKKAESKTSTIKKDDVKKATVTNEDGVTYGKAFHVSFRADLNKWQVRATGAQKALKTFNTQKEANAYADQLAANQGASVRVHTKEGRIRKHNSKVNK